MHHDTVQHADSDTPCLVSHRARFRPNRTATQIGRHRFFFFFFCYGQCASHGQGTVYTYYIQVYIYIIYIFIYTAWSLIKGCLWWHPVVLIVWCMLFRWFPKVSETAVKLRNIALVGDPWITQHLLYLANSHDGCAFMSAVVCWCVVGFVSKVFFFFSVTCVLLTAVKVTLLFVRHWYAYFFFLALFFCIFFH